MSSLLYPSFIDPFEGVAEDHRAAGQWEGNLELLEAIQTIQIAEEGADADEKDICISDVKSIGSYNRMDKEKLTIVVPGECRRRQEPCFAIISGTSSRAPSYLGR